MTKPWEETWTCERITVGKDRCAIDSGVVTFGDNGGRYYFKPPEMGALIAAAPDLYRALADVEWGDNESEYGAKCPTCGGMEPSPALSPALTGHRPDCALAAALKKARGER